MSICPRRAAKKIYLVANMAARNYMVAYTAARYIVAKKYLVAYFEAKNIAPRYNLVVPVAAKNIAPKKYLVANIALSSKEMSRRQRGMVQ